MIMKASWESNIKGVVLPRGGVFAHRREALASPNFLENNGLQQNLVPHEQRGDSD